MTTTATTATIAATSPRMRGASQATTTSPSALPRMMNASEGTSARSPTMPPSMPTMKRRMKRSMKRSMKRQNSLRRNRTMWTLSLTEMKKLGKPWVFYVPPCLSCGGGK